MSSIFPFLMSLLTSLPNLILTAEKAFSGAPGSGDAKKKLVLDTTAAALDITSRIDHAPLSHEQSAIILNGVSQLTDATVATLNAADALGHTKS